MVKITTLIENRAPESGRLQGEHGISVYIQRDNDALLFDTGQSDGFLHNAHRLRIDLHQLDKVAISHGHYDHANGLEHLVHSGHSRFRLHVGDGFFDRKYRQQGVAKSYNGPSFDRPWLKEHGVSVETVDGPSVEIGRDMWLVREFDRTDPAEENNPAFVVERDGHTVVDDFSDEIALVIKENGALLVFVGCSHPGIVNMVSTIRNRFTEPIRAVIGGFHLLHETPERVEAVGRFFQDLDLQMFGACHCTGTEAMQILKGMIPGYFDNMSGTEVRFP